MDISFAVCTHNEGREIIEPLISQLKDHKSTEKAASEVVIIDDFSTCPTTIEYLNECMASGIYVYHHSLNGNFAEHKNFMNSHCRGKWILNLDADETIAPEFLESWKILTESNPEVELWFLPRLNTVEGLTSAHVSKWGWVISEVEVESGTIQAIQWPDYQGRFYKNKPEIKWVNKVHERIDGADYYAALPASPEYAIFHHKDIARQEKQNEFYNTL